MNVKTEKSQTTVSFDNLREKNDVSFDLQVVNDVNTAFFEFFPMNTPQQNLTLKKNTFCTCAASPSATVPINHPDPAAPQFVTGSLTMFVLLLNTRTLKTEHASTKAFPVVKT